MKITIMKLGRAVPITLPDALMRTVQLMAIKDAYECPLGKEQEVVDARIKKMIDDEKKSK
jgi:antitoxin component of MazEF toxin-antitoxin module